MSDTAKNIGAQYEALGRFVKAFEGMVSEARESAISLVERHPNHGRLVAIALHHSSLTAKPSFDIFRAVVAEIVKDALNFQEAKKAGREHAEPPLLLDPNGEPLNLTLQDRDALFGALPISIGISEGFDRRGSYDSHPSRERLFEGRLLFHFRLRHVGKRNAVPS